MRKYPTEQHEFICNNVAGHTTRQLTAMFNREFGLSLKECTMKSYKKNHGLKSGTPCGLPAGCPTKLYPQEVRDFIYTNYKGVGHQGMADKLNEKFGTHYTKGQMKALYSRFRLNSGRTGRFPKGHVPVNKGKKGHSYPGMENTQFKKGHLPHNWWPVGKERITRDGYTEVKVAEPNKWKLKHRLIWEDANGPIPKGCVIIFLDGDKANCSLENLVMISQRQNAVLNKKKLRHDTAEATKTGILIADVLLKMNDRKGRPYQKKRKEGSDCQTS